MLLIDKNATTAEHNLVDYLNEKMVTDISWRVDKFTTRYGVERFNITFKVFTLHMEFGIIDYFFQVEGLHQHNMNVLLNNLESYFKGITGNIA